MQVGRRMTISWMRGWRKIGWIQGWTVWTELNSIRRTISFEALQFQANCELTVRDARKPITLYKITAGVSYRFQCPRRKFSRGKCKSFLKRTKATQSRSKTNVFVRFLLNFAAMTLNWGWGLLRDLYRAQTCVAHVTWGFLLTRKTTHWTGPSPWNCKKRSREMFA